jgi:hypothetical protein
MSRIAHITLTDRAVPTRRGPGILQRLHRHLAGVEKAMAGQARRTALSADILGDSRLTPDELTDTPSHDPALPFFMQAGFGRHQR